MEWCRIVLGAGMIAVRGRVQREGEVVHFVAERLTDLLAELASVLGERGPWSDGAPDLNRRMARITPYAHRLAALPVSE